MKRLLLTAAMIGSGSGTIFATENNNFSFKACYVNGECVRYFSGNLEDFVGPITTTYRAGEKVIPKVVKSRKKEPGGGFISFIAGATGHAVYYVREAFGGIRNSVLSAGYDKFEGKLSGPSGSVEFEYNFKTDKWIIKN